MIVTRKGKNGGKMIVEIEGTIKDESLQDDILKDFEFKDVYVKLLIDENKLLFSGKIDGDSIKEKNLKEFNGKVYKALVFETEKDT